MKQFQRQKYIDQLSIDCVIFGYKKKELKVLISKIALGDNLWSLPGGFIYKEEGIDDAAKRILNERTSVTDIYLDQFYTFGHDSRSNNAFFEELKKNPNTFDNSFNAEDLVWLTQRFISIGYYALVDINKVEPQKGDFDEIVQWMDTKTLPLLIMDHNEIVNVALQVLRQDFDKKLIGFNLLPETFTMKELKELYETVYDKPFARNNFQKKILDLGVLERLEKKFTGAANKAPYLYRFKK